MGLGKIDNRLVTHVLKETLPEKGLRRIRYYTQDNPCNNNNPYFNGMGGMFDSVERIIIDDWIAEGYLMELPEPLKMIIKNDLWLGVDGHLYTGYAYAPWKNQKIILRDFLSYFVKQ